jgi:hypothetical protein
MIEARPKSRDAWKPGAVLSWGPMSTKPDSVGVKVRVK